MRRADHSSRGVLPRVVYVIECDQVQQYYFTPALSRQKRSGEERKKERKKERNKQTNKQTSPL